MFDNPTQFGRERGISLISWELLLTSIGTGWLVRQLFRVIDLIERR